MIVVDASVLANALTDDGPLGQVARMELAHDVHWSGPEHLLVEAFSAVRGRLLGRRIVVGRARDAAYVAAAEAHNCTLLTSDRRLAQGPGVRCAVRLALPA